METGPRLKVSSDRLEKPGIEPGTPGLQGKWLIHYTTADHEMTSRVYSRIFIEKQAFYLNLSIFSPLSI